ncbi:hypothetical protein BpHYR1_046171 [Brachionus plicatilis]|uniref:Uncharacterized protein n=1 Tax=Brachionus plicatilis TaxID=10195 RepID=A0A3M7QBV9_BRAPC|nr:hypothetical protein BpHYR1_046171 [Brachionus plicatilis]
MVPTAFSALIVSRHASITRAPRLAKSKAVSNPMPLSEPVTTTTFPSSFFSDLFEKTPLNKIRKSNSLKICCCEKPNINKELMI